MKFDDLVPLVKREVDLAASLYGHENATRRPEEWVAFMSRRLGHLANASASRNISWFAEELVKIAAAAMTAAGSVSEAGFASLDTDGLAVIDHVGGPRPRIATKVTEPPGDAVLVAADAVGVVVGNGKVWVIKNG